MTWTDLLIESSLRPIFIAAVIALAIVALRVRSTVVQLRLWTIVLASAVLMPVLVATTTARVPIPVLPASWDAVPIANVATDPLAAAARRATPSAASPAADVRPVASASPGRSWSAASAVLYVAGLVVLLVRALLGWVMAVRLERSATDVEHAAARDRFEGHARRLGLRRMPRLAAHDRLFVPISTSVQRPAILLPVNWHAWTAVKFDAVIVHELSHIARHDTLIRRVSSIYRACFWFNPLAWWLHQRIASLSERASDEAALAGGVDPATYAATLLDFFRTSERPRLASWHVAMARGRGAERRVEWILAWEAPMVRHVKLTMVLLGLLLVPAVLTAAIAQPVAIAKPTSTVAAPAEMTTTPPPSVAAIKPETPPASIARPNASRASSGRKVASQQRGASPRSVPEPQSAVRPGSGVTHPVLVRTVKPRYPPAARAAGVAGTVEIEAVIGVDGTVIDLRVTRSLDTQFGLDAEAVRAAGGWLFKPGMRDGKPVATIVTLILEFRLDPSRTPEELLFDDALADDTPGLVKPELLRSVEAKYTADALRAKIQGIVEIDVVVQADGTVGAARVVRSLDSTFGLDDMALHAARAWSYRPGTLNGTPVPVLTRVTVSFRIH